jgi:hypothetical protein
MDQLSLGNGYQIDLADGWTFVHALENALDDLKTGYEKNFVDIYSDVVAPGQDPHSANFHQTLADAVDRHRQWYADKAQSLTQMINNVRGVLNRYGIAETANTITWGAGAAGSPGNGENSSAY